MRIVQYDKPSEDVLIEVANEYNLDPEELWGTYLRTIKHNYAELLDSLASDMADYKKGA